MGAGKTTVGRMLARRLSKAFYDSDHVVEERTGVRVRVIFDIEGEAGFRKREAEELARLTQLENVVLATGGGAVLNARSREHLKRRGCVVYLHARPAELAKRLGRDRSRPLLHGSDPRARLEALYQERDPLYREVADLVLDTGRQSVNQFVACLIAKLDSECKLSA
ncbi:MAG: shikimate kinase [Betaproteobacteria bacterium RIFCSPLOWO2_02_FULL_65_24]|nr:MAG: shikimate kinase [Betaproteobacteria bacterium RIFCSPLOWO2_02_FULL_65_24]OGA80383.1 MAG: shikimate kinase [Betaproteobacteria bacterium RIFCSPLOWO2_12_FULL_66_14]